jgi:hypothetical protein
MRKSDGITQWEQITDVGMLKGSGRSLGPPTRMTVPGRVKLWQQDLELRNAGKQTTNGSRLIKTEIAC